MACTSRPVDGIVIQVAVYHILPWRLLPRGIGPTLLCPFVRAGQGDCWGVVAGRQADSWYLFPLLFMSSLSSLWWFTCRGLCVHHVQGNFLDLRCWYKYNCLCKKMVLIRLWIPKYCLLDIICLDIYACSCVVLHIVMLECGIFYQPQNMLYIQFVLESRLIYLYILYFYYSLLAIIICCVELFAKLSWLPLVWVLFLGLRGGSPPSPSPWMWQEDSSSTHSPKLWNTVSLCGLLSVTDHKTSTW